MAHDTFLLEQVSQKDCDALADLALSEGGTSLLHPEKRQVCVDACVDHNGLLLRAPDGNVIGSCFTSRRELPFHRATHRAPDTQLVTYFQRYLLARAYRNRGLGKALLMATIAYEYGRWDGPFPDVVGVGFSDNKSQVLDRVGVLRFHESSYAQPVHRTMLAVQAMVEQNTRSLETFSRGTETLILDMDCMPAIARWAIQAYSSAGFCDERRRTIVRIVDPSDGLSGIVNELECLANKHVHALERIGLSEARKLAS